MLRYTIKRLIWMIPVLFGVSILVFAIQVLAPGDPADLALGEYASEEAKDAWREERGLNEPIIVQYGEYMAGILTRGDFGNSYQNGKSVTESLVSRFPVTLLTAFGGALIAALIGIPLGIVAATHRNTWVDSAARFLGMLGISLPNFWFALLLIMLFALNLKWLPVSGFYGPKYWILPLMAQGILGAASQMRYTRSAVLDSLQSDFVRTARAKGQTENKVVMHHVLGNAMIPIVTNVGHHIAGGMAGTVVMEQIFSIAGIGTLMITAVNNRDFPMLRGCVLLVAFTMSIVNLVVDLSYTAIDPRIKSRFVTPKKARKAGKEAAAA